MASTAVLNGAPSGRLNEKVVATNGPWWLIDSGVRPGAKLLNAESGTMFSARVLTEAPVDAAPLTVLAMAFWDWLRTASEATSRAVLVVAAAAAGDAEATVVVPATAPVDWVPLILPDVLT